MLLSGLALAAGLLSPARVLAEDFIRGSVENLSRNQPAAGDDVVVLGMDRAAGSGPPAVARAKTDAQGAFLLPVPGSGTAYLVRVLHQGVSYDLRASAGDNLSIAVFDAQPRVPAISGSIEILRLGTRAAAGQKLLHVSDMYEIRNDSNPPITKAGASTFEVYLPANAKIGSVLAAGPSPRLEGGQEAAQDEIGRMISAKPVAGEPGHYTVNFPLRPGASKFAFNYDLPYQSHTLFETSRQYSVQEFAVMMPWTMRFSSPSSAFHPLTKSQDQYQVEAVTQLKAGRGPQFEVSGYGAPPPFPTKKKEQVQPHSPGLPSSAGNRSADNRSTPTLPVTRPRPGSKSGETPSWWRWPVLAGCLVLACFLVVLARRPQWLNALRRASERLGVPRPASQSPASSVENLKQKLFQLEIDRVRKSISSEEYSSARLALEETVKRAALRASGGRAVGARSPKAGKT
ncbi:MAG: hypothetical protein J2P13_06245 [Acidobacteria bacterium]|nr:hypothetical protein [Acidobacteriota bacterium]